MRLVFKFATSINALYYGRYTINPKDLLNFISVRQFITRINIILAIFFPVLYLGIGSKYPWILLGHYGIGIGDLCFSLLTICIIIGALFIQVEKISSHTLLISFSLNLTICAIFILIYDILQYKHFKQFGYQLPTILYVLESLFILFILFYTYHNSKHTPKSDQITNLSYSKIKNIYVICAIIAVVHLIFSIHYFPLNILRSDMLYLLKLHNDQFLNGGSLYKQIVPNHLAPMYMPISFFSFIVGSLINIDLRLIGLVYTVIFMYLIFKNFDKINKTSQLLLCLMLINPYWIMRHDLYFQFFILEIVVLIFYFAQFNNFFKILFLAVFITTYQFAWILFPFILLAYGKNVRQIIIHFILAILLGALIIFLLTNRHYDDFLKGIFVAHLLYLHPYSTDITFGISPLFYFASSQKLLYFSQIVGCVIILANCVYQYLIKNKREFSYFMLNGALCYFYFLITNYYLETYLLIPMVLTMALVTGAPKKIVEK